MPRVARSVGHIHSPLDLAFYGVRRAAVAVAQCADLMKADRTLVSDALWRIDEGERADKAFGLRSRGRPPSPGSEAWNKQEAHLDRLVRIALDIKRSSSMPDWEREYLFAALARISTGHDADLAFGVKAKRGERRTRRQRIKPDEFQAVISWIAAAKRPWDEHGLGITLDEAITRAARLSGYTYETLTHAWSHGGVNRTASFPRPLDDYPDRSESSVNLKPENN
jgi:hypothetical protein